MMFWQLLAVICMVGCHVFEKRDDYFSDIPQFEKASKEPSAGQESTSEPGVGKSTSKRPVNKLENKQEVSFTGKSGNMAGESEEQTEFWSRDKREIHASLNYLLGEYAVLDRGLIAAGQYFQKSYDLSPNSYVGAKVMSTRLMDADSGSKIMMEAKRMVLLYPKSVDLRIIFARVLYDNKLKDQAIQQAQKAVDLDAHNEESHATLIQMLAASNKKDAALVGAQKFVVALPNSQNANFIYASLLIEKKQYTKAIALLSRILEVDEHSPDLLALYGYSLEANGQTAKAVAVFEEMFRVAPSDLALAGRVVQLYKSAGGLEKAVSIFDRLSQSLKIPVQSVEIQRAYIRIEIGQMENALLVLQNANKLFPDSEVIPMLLGLTYNWMGQDDQAISVLIKIKPDSKYFIRAAEISVDVYEKQQRYLEIINLMESLPKTAEISQGLVSGWARAYSELDHDEKALELVETYEKRDPDNPYFVFLRGVYLEKFGKFGRAIDAMKRTLELDPKNAAAMNFLAYMYAEKSERLEEAESLVKEALRLRPGDPFYSDTLAWVYYRQGKLVEAEKILQEILLLETKELVIYEHLAEIKMVLKKNHDCLEILRGLIPQVKDDREGKKMKEKLLSIQKECGK